MARNFTLKQQQQVIEWLKENKEHTRLMPQIDVAKRIKQELGVSLAPCTLKNWDDELEIGAMRSKESAHFTHQKVDRFAELAFVARACLMLVDAHESLCKKLGEDCACPLPPEGIRALQNITNRRKWDWEKEGNEE